MKKNEKHQNPNQVRHSYYINRISKKMLSFIKKNIVVLAFILPICALIVISPVVLNNLKKPSEKINVNSRELILPSTCESFSNDKTSDLIVHSEKINSAILVEKSNIISEANSKIEENKKPTDSPVSTIIVDIEEEKSKDIMLNTASYFTGRKIYLEEAMRKNKYFYDTVLLDPETKTSAYILAIDKNYAANLNGFYYYLIDETASTSMISPATLNLSILFDENNRKKCTLEKTYAQEDLLKSFELSLQALLGDFYHKDIFNFIYEEYKELFQTRLDGKKLPIYTKKISYPGLDIIFRNSFMTYVEFFLS